MTEKALAARRAYKRRWARENRDKVRAQQDRYWQRQAEKMEQTEEAQEPERIGAPANRQEAGAEA